MAYSQKSPSITNLDANPAQENAAGRGAPGYVVEIGDTITPTTAELGSTATKYAMVRLQSNCVVKSMNIRADGKLDTNGVPTFKIDVGAYYSDASLDGTKVSNQGVAISTNAFVAATAFASTASADLNVALTAPQRTKRLWDALGLTSDPGGFIDVVVAVNAVAATAAAVALSVSVMYTPAT